MTKSGKETSSTHHDSPLSRVEVIAIHNPDLGQLASAVSKNHPECLEAILESVVAHMDLREAGDNSEHEGELRADELTLGVLSIFAEGWVAEHERTVLVEEAREFVRRSLWGERHELAQILGVTPESIRRSLVGNRLRGKPQQWADRVRSVAVVATTVRRKVLQFVSRRGDLGEVRSRESPALGIAGAVEIALDPAIESVGRSFFLWLAKRTAEVDEPSQVVNFDAFLDDYFPGLDLQKIQRRLRRITVQSAVFRGAVRQVVDEKPEIATGLVRTAAEHFIINNRVFLELDAIEVALAAASDPEAQDLHEALVRVNKRRREMLPIFVEQFANLAIESWSKWHWSGRRRLLESHPAAFLLGIPADELPELENQLMEMGLLPETEEQTRTRLTAALGRAQADLLRFEMRHQPVDKDRGGTD